MLDCPESGRAEWIAAIIDEKVQKRGYAALFSVFIGRICHFVVAKININEGESNNAQKWGKMKRVKAEFTVEAALVVPIVLFVFLAVMQQGIKLYTETKETAAAEEEISYDAVTDFRKKQLWSCLLE